MKCVCGYEGDDFSDVDIRDGDYSPVHVRIGNTGQIKWIIICPVCGTLKIETGEDDDPHR
jgi:hypothetical protein